MQDHHLFTTSHTDNDCRHPRPQSPLRVNFGDVNDGSRRRATQGNRRNSDRFDFGTILDRDFDRIIGEQMRGGWSSRARATKLRVNRSACASMAMIFATSGSGPTSNCTSSPTETLSATDWGIEKSMWNVLLHSLQHGDPSFPQPDTDQDARRTIQLGRETEL